MKILKLINEKQVLAEIICNDDSDYARNAGILRASGWVEWKPGTFVDPSVYGEVRRRGWKPSSAFSYQAVS